MERIDPREIADALLSAAGWARAGITAPSERIRHQAAKELALTIVESLTGEELHPNLDQLSLPI